MNGFYNSLKHITIALLIDAIVVNLGLFLGLAARYAVLVGLNEAPKILLDYTTPADLWEDSLRAYQAVAPLLTAICLLALGLSGFYRANQPYHSRQAKTIMLATGFAFLIFAFIGYSIVVVGYLARWSGFLPFPRSALFASWIFTLGLLLAARQGAAVWRSAREGRLTGQVIRNRYFFIVDLLFVAIAAWLSFEARLESADWSKFRITLIIYLLVVLAVKPLAYYLFGFYRRYWRYASIGEVVTIVGANVVATMGVIAGVYLFVPIFFSFDQVPRSIPFIDLMLATALTGGARFGVRLLGDRRTMSQLWRETSLVTPAARRVLIIGAGDAGAMIAKEMQANPQLGLEPVVFLDDDVDKHGTRILGIPVAGDRRQIDDVVKEYKLHQAVIAMPTAPGKTIRELTRLCQLADVPVKTVPGMFELLNGSVTVNQLRPVDIADLLRREPVETDRTQVAELLRGKRILITGAGGSIGGELCRQIAPCEPERLILLGHGENSLFQISNEMRRGYPHLLLQTVVADIRNHDRLAIIFEREQPQVVFHAAAHKHVPMMEDNIEDAVTNNVLGTRNVLHAAAVAGVTHFVLISTDKAVNPTSVMGTTKRIAELLVQQAAAETGHSFVAVRFGNVLGSRGSVVPFFKEQIARGGPVTVTHPEIRRYFMTIPEAVQLVLQAAALGKGGEIFVLDMGEPIKIVDMARELIHLSGLEEGRDIDIEFTGLRPGEKLFEELFLSGENYERTLHAKIFVAHNTQSVDPGRVDVLIAMARQGESGEVRQLLRSLVSEYGPASAHMPSAQPPLYARDGSGRLTIPTKAIRTAGTRKYVSVVRDGKPHPVEVRVGVTTGHRTEILSGLAGDEVIQIPQA